MRKIFNRFGRFLGKVIGSFIAYEVTKSNIKRLELKRKLKYFKPTMHERIIGSSVTWEMRDTPLTDKEVEELL